MLHYTMVALDKTVFDEIVQRAKEMKITYRKGRMLASAEMKENWEAFYFQDPDSHWVEIIYKN